MENTPPLENGDSAIDKCNSKPPLEIGEEFD
jgi:hypothetical protein